MVHLMQRSTSTFGRRVSLTLHLRPAALSEKDRCRIRTECTLCDDALCGDVHVLVVWDLSGEWNRFTHHVLLVHAPTHKRTYTGEKGDYCSLSAILPQSAHYFCPLGVATS